MKSGGQLGDESADVLSFFSLFLCECVCVRLLAGLLVHVCGQVQDVGLVCMRCISLDVHLFALSPSLT